MAGKVIIITGANSGLGFEAANVLAGKGHHVIMGCRTEARAQEAMAKIKKKHTNAQLSFLQMELTDMESVHKFVQDFHAMSLPLFALVNNAGIAMPFKDTDRKTTKAGWEITMASNHFGHFLLTNLLLEDLKTTASISGEARIVNISSGIHNRELAKRAMRSKTDLNPLDLDDLMLEKEGAYNGMQAYRNSKCANILFTKGLAQRLQGTAVTATCMCPGLIPDTGLGRNNGAMIRFVMKYIIGGIVRRISSSESIRTIDQGAADIVRLSVDTELKGETGSYFEVSKVTDPDPECLDPEKQQRLWELSEAIVGLSTKAK